MEKNDETHITFENVLVIVIGILSVLANSCLILVMIKDPLKEFRTKISYLVICLAVADLLTAINGILYGILFSMNMYDISLWYLIWTSVLVSVFTVFGMCVERWFAILYPFKSNSVRSKKLTLYFCIGVWIICGGMASSIHFLPLVSPFVLSSTLEMFLFVIVFLYLNMLHGIKQNLKTSNAVGDVPSSQKEAKTNLSKRYKMAIEAQLVKVVSILVLIMFLTFIPYNLAIQINYGYLLFRGTSPSSVTLFARYFFPVKFLNFLLNPFVYAWRLKKYRKSFSLVFCRWKRKKVIQVISSGENNFTVRGFDGMYSSR
ncbi:lysophosphatidic acid receptor 4-like [Xenia sp. Carnegie-2017]|uniref:lysophosphatidic acid receptor 4-like n=1 Tax=Xenia sp. Carnegie-2017 TaxID=2897299 RepID=UPI001F0359BE|nr:lysophosphatidic acid receptor 4-like [Xenia sp. Carnegie-2017]